MQLSNGRMNNMKESIIILCLLGDPSLPAGSCDRTGGFNVDMAEILKYWSSFPYSITVITNSSSYASQNHVQLYDNIDVYRVALEDDIMNSQPQLANRFPHVLQQTISIIEEAHIKPIFFHSYYWYSGLLALYLAQRYEVKFLHSVVALAIDKKISNSSNFCPVQYEFENSFFPHASLVFAISNAEKQTLLKYYLCKEEQILVVGRAVDEAFFLPDHDNKGISPVLLQDNDKKWNMYLKEYIPNSWWYQGAFTYIGRIKYEKGVGIIVEAWYQLHLIYKDEMPPLWIVGGQPDTISPIRDELAKQYKDFSKLEKEMKICWWGYLTPASINAILLKTSTVITHSQYEAGGRVIIEALSAGKPVIATPTGFAADLIRDWKNGFLVPFGDVELLKKRMEHFLKQPLITNPLGMYARCSFQKAAESWHYYEKHKEVYEYLYDEQHEQPNWGREAEDIFKDIPNYYNMKLLYPWPGPQELKDKIVTWCKKTWHTKNIKAEYRVDLSHHSFIWTIRFEGTEYYIKQFYTKFNDSILWNKQSPIPELIRGSELYHAANANSLVTLDVKLKNEQLFCYITEKAERLSYKHIFGNYNNILEVIFQFDITYSVEKLKINIAEYTYDQMLESIMDVSDTSIKIYNEFLQNNLWITDVLKKDNLYELAFSYGKTFFSHILNTSNGYRLLPSASVYRAPLGMDAAVFLIEIEKEFHHILNPELFCQLLRDAAKIFHISELQMYRLCLAVVLLETKKQQYLTTQTIQHSNYIFWKTILEHLEQA